MIEEPEIRQFYNQFGTIFSQEKDYMLNVTERPKFIAMRFHHFLALCAKVFSFKGQNCISWIIHPLKLFIWTSVLNIHLHNFLSLSLHTSTHSTTHRFRYPDQGSEERGWICDQWGKDVDHQRYPGWLDVSPGQHQWWASTQEQIPLLFAHEPAR